jgi:hypothetical protein
MAASPRVVTADTRIMWDGVPQRLPRGQVIDVPPGSALEEAIGTENLVPLGATATSRPAAEPAAPAADPAPRKPRGNGKTQDAAADLTGEST